MTLALKSLLFGIILIISPLLPPVQILMSRFYLFNDSLWLLGGTLITGSVSSYVLPGRLIQAVEWLANVVRSKSIWFIAFFALTTLILLGWVNQTVLVSFMNSADEHSCLFLA